jgi:hypothetical protein
MIGILTIRVVMPGLVPGIHAFRDFRWSKAWMAGTSPAMTIRRP